MKAIMYSLMVVFAMSCASTNDCCRKECASKKNCKMSKSKDCKKKNCDLKKK